MGVVINEEMALRAIGKNLILFEKLFLSFMHPSKKLSLIKGLPCTVRFGTKKATRIQACFNAAMLVQIYEYGESGKTVSLTDNAAQELLEYAIYYALNTALMEKELGVVVAEERDEYGLPVFEGITEKLLEAEKKLNNVYGVGWRDKVRDMNLKDIV